MDGDFGSSILILHQDVELRFVECIVRLLRALFPASIVEVTRDWRSEEPQSESGARPEGPSKQVVVLVGFDGTWFSSAKEQVGEHELLCIQLARNQERLAPDVAGFDASDPSQLEEFVGQLAQGLDLDQPVDVGAHRGKLYELADSARVRGNPWKVWLGRLALACVVVCVLAFAGALTARWMRSSGLLASERCGFEDDRFDWKMQDTTGTRGCIGVRRTSVEFKTGGHSLEILVDLDPTVAERNSAETWTDLTRMSLPSKPASLDLHRRSITAWVKPTVGVVGDPRHPSGFQLYAKDQNWKSCYGPWLAASAGDWQKLVLDVGEGNSAQHLDPGFDGHAVIAIGIKVALPSGAMTKASGSVYVDSVSW